MINYHIFYNNVIGQGIEVSSKQAGFQCMDLAYLWVFCNDVPKRAIQQPHAYMVYKNPNSTTLAYFDIIKNTADYVPKTGDLVVFDRTPTNPSGHICIATGEGNVNWFRSIDQNIGGSYVRAIKHDYKNCLGCLRLK